MMDLIICERVPDSKEQREEWRRFDNMLRILANGSAIVKQTIILGNP
jgi:hypothetical protein